MSTLNQLYAQNPPQFNATSTTQLVIKDILIAGNKKSKKHFIFRELTFAIGDTLALNKLQTTLDESRENLVNTNLFNKVNIDTLNHNGNQIEVAIYLEERWRIYPIPLAEISAPNYNIWLKDFNADLSWLSYGGYLSIYNIGGANNTLIFQALFGYRKHFIITSINPYIDKNKKWGLRTRLEYRSDKQVPVGTEENKLVLFPSNDLSEIPKQTLVSRWASRFTLRYRMTENSIHYLRTEFHHNKANEKVLEVNPQYFNNNETEQSYLGLAYVFENDQTDIFFYPRSGSNLKIGLHKKGLGLFKDIDNFISRFSYSLYRPITERFLWSGNISGLKNFGKEQPYLNNIRLGYSSLYIRGYEYYLIDTQQFAVLRNSFRYKLFQFSFNNVLRVKEKRKIYLEIYARLFSELAHVQDNFYSQNNPFNNRFLAGNGLGIDFVLAENIPISFEYTFNHLGEGGLYFHIGLDWDIWDIWTLF